MDSGTNKLSILDDLKRRFETNNSELDKLRNKNHEHIMK